ncbi:hypothetical protein Tco_0019393, partial [Tanacetum coccineum]
INHLNFFNTNTLDDLPNMPNDEERRNPSLMRHGNSPSHSGSPFASSKENDGGHFQDADASARIDQVNNDVSNLRRSSRPFVFPRNFNDFVVDSKVKYGLEKFVNYSHLSKRNYCFATMLNKGFEPKTYFEASEHKHWVDAMNAEMDALYRNNTWGAC